MIALEDDAGTKYRKLVISGGRIIGAILLGYRPRSPPVRTAITARHRRRHRTCEALRRGELGACSAPGNRRLRPRRRLALA